MPKKFEIRNSTAEFLIFQIEVPNTEIYIALIYD